MNLIQTLILACIQGAAELLPVSSSAHVIVAQRLMGLDPSSPESTFLLVMLHTGTMGAVLLFFWKRWKSLLISHREERNSFVKAIVIATGVTGVVGFGLKILIEKTVLSHESNAEIEMLFKSLPLMATALLTVGLFIIFTALRIKKNSQNTTITPKSSVIIGMVQGLCLPFRGFSRSGATISTALNLGISEARAEEFSFALAVVLTPAVIVHSLRRLIKSSEGVDLSGFLTQGLIGMFFSFVTGMIALRFLSAIIGKGRWIYFGYYCVFFSAVVMLVHWNIS